MARAWVRGDDAGGMWVGGNTHRGTLQLLLALDHAWKRLVFGQPHGVRDGDGATEQVYLGLQRRSTESHFLCHLVLHVHVQASV